MEPRFFDWVTPAEPASHPNLPLGSGPGPAPGSDGSPDPGPDTNPSPNSAVVLPVPIPASTRSPPFSDSKAPSVGTKSPLVTTSTNEVQFKVAENLQAYPGGGGSLVFSTGSGGIVSPITRSISATERWVRFLEVTAMERFVCVSPLTSVVHWMVTNSDGSFDSAD